MKNILEPIASVIYDSLVNLCLYFQGVFSSTWLIILSVLFIIASIFCFIKQSKDEFGNSNIWIKVTSGLLFAAVCLLFFSIGWDDFKHYNELDDSLIWILTTAVWIMTLIHIIVCYYYHKTLYSIFYVIALIIAMVLFSKFFVFLAIIFVLGAISGKADSGYSGMTSSSSSNLFSSNNSSTASSSQTDNNKIVDAGYHPKAYFQIEWKQNGQPLTYNANFYLPVDANVSDFIRELHKLHGGNITIVSYRRGNEPTVYLE